MIRCSLTSSSIQQTCDAKPPLSWPCPSRTPQTMASLLKTDNKCANCPLEEKVKNLGSALTHPQRTQNKASWFCLFGLLPLPPMCIPHAYWQPKDPSSPHQSKLPFRGTPAPSLGYNSWKMMPELSNEFASISILRPRTSAEGRNATNCFVSNSTVELGCDALDVSQAFLRPRTSQLAKRCTTNTNSAHTWCAECTSGTNSRSSVCPPVLRSCVSSCMQNMTACSRKVDMLAWTL